MSLTTTADIMIAVGITDANQTARIDNLRKKVEAAIKSYLKWDPELYVDTVDYYDGQGFIDIPLRRPFVKDVAEVCYDPNGYYGDGPSAFAATSVLTKGSDYVLKREGQLGKSGLLRRIGIATTLLFPSDQIFFGEPGGLSFSRGPYWPGGMGNIKVTYTSGWPQALSLSALTWAAGVATATSATKHGLAIEDRFTISGATPTGYNDDWQVASVPSTTQFTFAMPSDPGGAGTGAVVDAIPVDLKLAVATACMIIVNSVRYGWPMQSETGGDYSYSLNISRDVEFGSVRQLLSLYRDVSVGAGVA